MTIKKLEKFNFKKDKLSKVDMIVPLGMSKGKLKRGINKLIKQSYDTIDGVHLSEIVDWCERSDFPVNTKDLIASMIDHKCTDFSLFLSSKGVKIAQKVFWVDHSNLQSNPDMERVLYRVKRQPHIKSACALLVNYSKEQGCSECKETVFNQDGTCRNCGYPSFSGEKVEIIADALSVGKRVNISKM